MLKWWHYATNDVTDDADRDSCNRDMVMADCDVVIVMSVLLHMLVKIYICSCFSLRYLNAAAVAAAATAAAAAAAAASAPVPAPAPAPAPSPAFLTPLLCVLSRCCPAAVVCKSFFLRALEMIMKAENQRPIWQITRETIHGRSCCCHGQERTTSADLDQAGSASDEEATARPGGLLAIGRIHFWWHSLSRSNWCTEKERVEWNFRRLNEDGQLDPVIWRASFWCVSLVLTTVWPSWNDHPSAETSAQCFRIPNKKTEMTFLACALRPDVLSLRDLSRSILSKWKSLYIGDNDLQLEGDVFGKCVVEVEKVDGVCNSNFGFLSSF